MTAVTERRVPQKRKPSRIAEERRRNLIDAAIRNISSQGYNAVTIATICEEAGFSRGLIGHYFSGKDALLLEAVKSVAAELGQAIRDSVHAAPDPEAKLHAVVKASFTPPGFTSDKVAVWVSLAGAARWSTPLGEIYREIWHDYRAGVGRLFERAAQAAKTDLDPIASALTFSQMIEGFWIGWAADPKAVTPKAAAHCCHAYLDLLLRK
ncbi:MAG TPA: TetR family transcriptional regulator C-terminal domain-containing protein [Bordetella sp.]